MKTLNRSELESIDRAIVIITEKNLEKTNSYLHYELRRGLDRYAEGSQISIYYAFADDADWLLEKCGIDRKKLPAVLFLRNSSEKCCHLHYDEMAKVGELVARMLGKEAGKVLSKSHLKDAVVPAQVPAQ